MYSHELNSQEIYISELRKPKQVNVHTTQTANNYCTLSTWTSMVLKAPNLKEIKEFFHRACAAGTDIQYFMTMCILILLGTLILVHTLYSSVLSKVTRPILYMNDIYLCHLSSSKHILIQKNHYSKPLNMHWKKNYRGCFTKYKKKT
jgi:hypothetical protein